MTSHHQKMTMINRSNTGAGELETFAMANCLMLMNNQQATSVLTRGGDDVSQWFPCKTCGRKFSSFQALGGHRASHKKIKSLLSNEGIITELKSNLSSEKPKTHVCTICGAEFPIGQALGGHMRRHRQTPVSGGGSTLTVENSEISSGGDHNKRKVIEDEVNNNVVVRNLNKSSSGKRVCLDHLDLDLNLYLWNHQSDHQNDEGEVVEDDMNFFKLELRQPIN